jgi:ADP-ribose pyrophosphatase YjhB (NUDIX family)
MKFEPEKLFIGLMDFFSILLPGALLTALLMDEVGPVVLGPRYVKLEGAAAWAAFLFASYLLGHLVFLLGSWLDEVYDWARGHTLNNQIVVLARRGRLTNRPLRALVWLVFKRERNRAVRRAIKLREKALDALQAKDAINTFQWCKALLNSESPAGLAVIQRFEADSKFFRCFAVVLLLLLVAWPFQHRWEAWGLPVVIGLFLLALWRYMEQRYKSTNQAYWSVITLLAKDPKFAFPKPAALAFAKPAPPSPDTPTHAGGVVYRRRRKRVDYLLVEATDDPTEWVLPKGHIEEGEQPRETAVREVHEESGVWARIDGELEIVSYPVKKEMVTVKFFLMEKVAGGCFLMDAVGRGLHMERKRGRAWLPFEQAVKKATHEKAREQLTLAKQRVQPINASGSA